ncbi:extracellular solute-binding protein [Paenibacillus arenilitoris]|nr:extracellular solute-binding protein [Paenibacillus arenilitoris]
MRSKWKFSLLLLSVLALSATAACSGSEAGKETADAEETGTATGNVPADGAKSGGPLGKYDPPITLRTTLTDKAKDSLDAGDTLENNVWTRGYERELGIKVTYDWIVEGSNAGEKMNLTLASGDLPDILAVNQAQYKQLLEAGQLADLTEVYEQHASDLVKQFYAMGADGLQPTKQDGKLYGLTYYSGSYDTSPMLWIRTDWMKQLNLDPPQTMDDVIAIAKAFTEQDPDRNGENDTYGLALNKGLTSGGDINPTGFMNGYHAYPGVWLEDESGALAYGSIQPEMRTALAKLRELYAGGYIDPEFGTKDLSKSAETVMAGRIGLFFGYMTSPFAVSGMMKDGSEADWLPYPIPSADDKPALVQNNIDYGEIFAVRKDYEHPEALIQLMNFQVEKSYGESSKSEAAASYFGKEGFAPVRLLQPNKNIGIYNHVVDALEVNDPSGLNIEETSYYDGIQSYRGGDRSAWWFERIFGPDSSQSIIQHYIDNDLIKLNEFVHPSTDTMTAKGATLGKLELETFVKIIYGQDPIEAFDQFVKNWKALGGDQMTKEVNQIAQ